MRAACSMSYIRLKLAHLLESLPYNERNIIWELVNPEKEGEVLIQRGGRNPLYP